MICPVNRIALTAVISIVALLVLSGPAPAQEKVLAAVTAGFMQPFREMADHFEAATGTTIQATFASTGSLYNQIRNGAPYDIYLAGDEERPALLHRLSLAEEPFPYARGRVILWSANRDFCGPATWQEALLASDPAPIALVNPVTGPFGTVATAALETADLNQGLEKRLVFAQTVVQSFQYASTEAVVAGFCAQSALATVQGKKGCYYTIAEAPPVMMNATILTRTGQRDAAESFAAFLLSHEADRIKESWGFQ